MEKKGVAYFEEKTSQICENRQLAGCVCMAADHEGVIYEKAFGVRDLATGVSMTTDTVFEIFSMTKPIVSTACMQLVEKGLLDLDADVGNYVPDFKEPLVLERFDENGVPVLHKAKNKVTLRQLLSQTSGITHEIWEPLRRQWCVKFGIGGFGKEARRVPLCFEPGTDWAYGLGLDWVMECIQAVTGETLEAYLQRHVFQPLGMTSTSFHLNKEMEERHAAIHILQEDGTVESNTVLNTTIAASCKWHDYGDGEGHGGLQSTAEDYIRFLQMILGKGTYQGVQILKPESVEEMGRNQIGDLYMHWPQPMNKNAFILDLNDFPGGKQKAKWGLGWMVNMEETECGRAPGGMSWFGGLDTYMWVDRANDICGVVMCQSKPASGPTMISVFHDFEKMLHDRLDS